MDSTYVTTWFNELQRAADRARRWQAALETEVRPLGLGAAEVLLLWQIEKAGSSGISQVELARQSGFSTTQVCGLVIELQTAGRIEVVRSPQDRRRQCCRLSPAGQALLAQAMALLESVATKCLSERQRLWEDAA